MYLLQNVICSWKEFNVKENYQQTTRDVTLTFYKTTDKVPEIDEASPYEESPVCIFKTIYGGVIIGTMRKDFMGYMRVWTGWQSSTFSMSTEISEWAYATELL